MPHRSHRPAFWGIMIAVVIVSWGLAACLPIPYSERLSPALSGTIRNADGSAVEGVTIAVSSAWEPTSCMKVGARTTTDSSGHFALPEVRQHNSWIVLLGDQVSWYHVCALEGDSAAVIFTWSDLGHPPKTVSLQCTAALRPVPNTVCRERR